MSKLLRLEEVEKFNNKKFESKQLKILMDAFKQFSADSEQASEGLRQLSESISNGSVTLNDLAERVKNNQLTLNAISTHYTPSPITISPPTIRPSSRMLSLQLLNKQSRWFTS